MLDGKRPLQACSRGRWSNLVLYGYLISLHTMHGVDAFQSHAVIVRKLSLRPADPRLPRSRTTIALHDKASSDVDTWSKPKPAITAGVAVLLTVPVAWGTFEVAIRSVYALEPKVPAVLFALAYYTVASLALLLVATTTRIVGRNDHGFHPTNRLIETTSGSVPGYGNDTCTELSQTNEWPIQGGFELGFYLFLGNLCQMIGLQTVTADRAAFLLQLTTLFVPLAQAGFVDRNWSSISLQVWLACAVALAGVGVMSLDGEDHGTTQTWDSVAWDQFHWGTGDTLIVLAAVAYTFHCLRLEVHARTTWAVALGACKALTETWWSVLTVTVVILVAQHTSLLNDNSMMSTLALTGQECLDYIHTLGESNIVSESWRPAVGAVLWTGLVPVAYTIVAQTYGQGVGGVRPVTANLIYTIQPVCTAAFAYLVLHESLGLAGYVGGALIGAAVLLVVVSPGTDIDVNDGTS